MKRTIVTLFILLSAVQVQASWLSEMINDATNSYSGTASYETQKMGYNSLGGAQYRIPLRRDPLVSVAPPSLNVGCGGIDVFMGGIGFMDADYLVEKLKRSLKAAPYVAFDLGLKSLCSECSEVIKTVEQMANMLNSMEILPIRIILMKLISCVLIPTSITALDINGSTPCNKVTTSMMISSKVKLRL